MYLQRCHAISALGNEQQTAAALAAGRSALKLVPVLGAAKPPHHTFTKVADTAKAADAAKTANAVKSTDVARGAGTASGADTAKSTDAPKNTHTAKTAGQTPPFDEQAQASAIEQVPLALLSPMSDELPPRWWQPLLEFVSPLKGNGWGSARRPVFIAGSNYGVDNLYAVSVDKDHRRDIWAAPHGIITKLREQLLWGRNVTALSHACVSAQLALLLAERTLQNNLADEVLVLSFDFLSPFVSGGFHALKILNAQLPQPYLRRPSGAIGLGDGAAWAILSKTPAPHRILGQSVFNEMHHFTANAADGSGFTAVLEPLLPLAAGRRLLIKGHGTGTLQAAELEVNACAAAFGSQTPLVSWKGGIGHTLGSCALVELAIALAAKEQGRIPPTVFAEPAQGTPFGENVATTALRADAFDTTLHLSNAFGGAHAAMLIAHE